ncbi:toprim domain-containing protein [Maribacter sp. 4G9]|uniref:toprim domain-containing protein n=1 Tax=Maribacter sp. 4G9 TaxID=1889777 RepID=UPI000C144C78|nr:toprim domain-containing protein [Maribacter sp. 4G9]PIB38975.1 hypothetical protein BFP75_13765 [Maribacter sp. 4G9]
MKKERTNKLTCERARAFPIEKALAKLGHFPTRSTEKEAWFLSPFRTETQASFKVSKKLNRWYDHGEGIGGNVIDLVCKITKSSVKEALMFFEQDQSFFSFQQRPSNGSRKDEGLKVIHARTIRHCGLLNYLFERRISIATASTICKEVHYLFEGRRYFGIGLRNRSEGWELRNRYGKGSTSPKDVTMIGNRSKKLAVTEGMFDMLSLLELRPELHKTHDLLVLNSTAFVKRMIAEIGEYENVELFLDRDRTGMEMTELLLEKCPNSRDISFLYEGFKDMNEWMVKSTEDEVRKRIQDVSLS